MTKVKAFISELKTGVMIILKIIQEKITAEEIQNTEAGGLTEVRIILSVLKNLPAMTKAGMQTVQEKLKLLLSVGYKLSGGSLRHRSCGPSG